MLHLSKTVFCNLVNAHSILTIAHERQVNVITDIMYRIKLAALKSLIDAFVVGGIVFFSSIAGIGYANLTENLKLAFMASVTGAGLTFFTEMKKRIKVIEKIPVAPEKGMG